MALSNLRERSLQVADEFSADLHPVIRRIYRARGVGRDEQVRLGLGQLHPPGAMLNMARAVELLHEQMLSGGRILIVGDFDADGATSSALSVLCLRAMGHHQVDYLVPNRFEYGYGLTPEIVAVAQERAPALIMTVDNGVASHQGIAAAQALGIKVLVTDHHLPADTLPDADCILNPNLRECDFPSKGLAGVGVVFYLMMALRAHLRDLDWFEQRRLAEPNLAAFLDIVALGTVADVVPLDANNRRLVNHGLKVIRSGQGSPGILALLEVAGRNPASVQAADLGFAAGPRLNAAGRLDDISVGIECLLSEEPGRARTLARQLDDYNRDRRNIEQDMQAQAMALLEQTGLNENMEQPGICLYNADWHQGVIGILASRLKERFHRPVIAFADAGEDEDGVPQIKGSARSIRGIHMRDLLDVVAKRQPELLQKYGGHAMAAGLSLRKSDFERFAEAFLGTLSEQVDAELLQQVHFSDGELPASCLSLAFAQLLQEAGPWGQAFPEPSFHGHFRVISRRVLGERHLKLVVSPLAAPGVVIDAIAFSQQAEILADTSETLQLLYRLQVNEFRGACQPQLLVEQIAPQP